MTRELKLNNNEINKLKKYFTKKCKNINGKIYITIPVGMACYWICKRDNIHKPCVLLYVDYYDTKITNFISGYREHIIC